MCEMTEDTFSVIVFALKQKNSYFPKGLTFEMWSASQGFNVKAVLNWALKHCLFFSF